MMICPEDVAFLSHHLKERSGLVVTPDKGYLLESRLVPLVQRYQLKDLGEMVAKLRRHDETLGTAVTEAMTTNESFFFRDKTPFDQFEQVVLPQMMAAREDKRTLRIWSAACSSGQEAYSLAMILDSLAARLTGWKIEITGTDLSQGMVDKAKAGLYSQFEVQRGLPIQLLVKYFRKQAEHWQIDEKLRAVVRYKQWNLLHDLTPLGQFDIVFCRNVLIYFDAPTKAKVLESIAKRMPSDGLLFLGGAETVLNLSSRFSSVANQRGIYQLG